jgi:outer membrane protein OmpA-like peptidoglycan-associated protein
MTSAVLTAALLTTTVPSPAGASASSTPSAPQSATSVPAGQTDGTAWVLTELDRSVEGLVVTALALQPDDSTASLPVWLQQAGVGWCRQVHVVDPTTGVVGLAAPSGMGSGCATTRTDGSKTGGGPATVSVVVADPGGDRLDVVFDDVLVATDVPVTGGADPSSPAAEGVWTIHPRSTRPQPRFTRAGAAVTGQSVDLSADVLFAYDSDVLGPDAGAAIGVAAQQLQAQPSRTVTITGHTDSQGDTGYNLGLSQRRAEAVRAALVAQLGAGWTVNASGVGESDPVADKTPPAGVSKAEADAAVAEAQRVDRRVAVVPG